MFRFISLFFALSLLLRNVPFPASAQQSFSTTPHPARFVYVASSQQSSTPVLSINQQTGALKLIGFQGSQGMWPYVVNTPNGHFLYGGASPFLGYAVNQSTGGLTPVPGSPSISSGSPLTR